MEVEAPEAAEAELMELAAEVEVVEQAADLFEVVEGTGVGQAAAANLLTTALGMATMAQSRISVTAMGVGEGTVTYPRILDGARMVVVPILASTIVWSLITTIIPTHHLITPQPMR